MVRTAIIDLMLGRVINIIEFEGAPSDVPPAGQNWVASDTAEIGDVWNGTAIVSVAQRLPAPTAEQLFALGEIAAQANLDAVAWSWRYGDRPGPGCFDRAVSYANSTVAQWRADAAALIAWRDDYWRAAFNIQAAINAGAVDVPETPDAFVALLPPPPARPTV